MYSILPALVASVFLGYGTYVICTKGSSRITKVFFIVCVTSFFWQGTWAVLFQTRDPQLASFLVKFGYFSILFLPTSLYHFLIEVAECTSERQYVYLSYAIAGMLAPVLIYSDSIVAGYYDYFWGYYPRAGRLHWIHMLQTALVVSRGLYVTYRRRDEVSPGERTKLNLCIGGVLVYFLAAVDYVCNYGIELYPPGAMFIAIGLGMIVAVAVARYDLLNPMAMAAAVTHEMRTPLLSIRMQARGLDRHFPTLLNGYALAVEHGLCEPVLQTHTLEKLSTLGYAVTQEIDRTNIALDMLLAYIRTERFDKNDFSHYAVEDCIACSLDRYVFEPGERASVHVAELETFVFRGSDALLTLVLLNLLKNAFYAIKAAGKGTVEISTCRGSTHNELHFKDTGAGIPTGALPHLFDAFFTTKKNAGSGLGLAFCKRVMTAFGGSIRCDSVVGEYAIFTLKFPAIKDHEEREKAS
jgi:signal transduction histidine kinase